MKNKTLQCWNYSHVEYCRNTSETVYEHNVEPASFAFSLSILYLLLFLTCAFQLMRLVYHKHRIAHYQSVFLLLCGLWCLLRWPFFLWAAFFANASLFLPPGSSANVLYSSLNAFPVPLQFATFSLLVMYFGEVVHKKTWRRLWRVRFVWAYCVINGLFFLWTIANIISLSVVTSPRKQRHLSEMWGYSVGVIFLILVSTLGVYAFLVARLLRSSVKPVNFSASTTTSPVKILLFSFLIVAVYVFRSLYDFVSAADSRAAIQVESGGAWNPDGRMFVFYFFTEIAPLVVTIMFFWRMPSASPAAAGDDDDAEPLTAAAGRIFSLPSAPLLVNAAAAAAAHANNIQYQEPGSYGSLTGTPRTPLDAPTLSELRRPTSIHQLYIGTGYTPYATTPTQSTPGAPHSPPSLTLDSGSFSDDS